MAVMNHSEVNHLKSLVSYVDGATVSKIISKGKGGSTTIFAFDKGQTLAEHTAPFDATVIVLDGSCKIEMDGESYIVNEGQMIIMPANVPHALEAIESFKMLLIMVRNDPS